MSRTFRGRPVAALAVAVVVASVVAACGGGGGGGGAAKGSAVINAISSRTGPGAPYGALMTQGAEMGAAKVNSSGGIGGKQIKVDTQDDGSDPARGVTLLQKLAPGAGVVLFNTLSSVVAQVAPASNDMKLPSIGPAISASNLVTENRPYIFSTFPQLALAVPKAVSVWHDKENVSTASMILDNQNEATKSQADLYQAAMKTAGISLKQNVAVATQDVDFGAAVQRALRDKPDGIVISALPEQAAAIVRAVRSASPDTAIFLPTAGFVPSVLKKVAGNSAINGVYTVQVFFGGKGATAPAQKFAQQFQAKYKTPADGTAAFSYEEMLMLQQAAKDGAYTPGDSSQPARDKLRNWLSKLDWNGPFGHLVMGSNGIVKRDAYVLRVDSQGNPQLVDTVTAGS